LLPLLRFTNVKLVLSTFVVDWALATSEAINTSTIVSDTTATDRLLVFISESS
jgi:hypothetical protein